MHIGEHLLDESKHRINTPLHTIHIETNKLNATGDFVGYIQVHTAKRTLHILHFQHFKRKSQSKWPSLNT